MARKLITFRVCDLHGGEQVRGAEPVRFGIDGRVYEADACPACAARLRAVLEQFTSRASRAAGLPACFLAGHG